MYRLLLCVMCALMTVSLARADGVQCAEDDLLSVYDDTWGRVLTSMHYADGFLFVSRNGVLVTLDVRDPMNPIRYDFRDLGPGWVFSKERLDDGLIFVVGRSLAWIPIDENNLMGDTQVLFQLPETVYDIAHANNYLYLTTVGELHVYDVTDPANTTLLSVIPVPDTGPLDLDEDHLMINSSSIVRVYDRTMPMSPVEVGSFVPDVDEDIEGADFGDGLAHIVTNRRVMGLDLADNLATSYESQTSPDEIVNHVHYASGVLYLSLDRLGVRLLSVAPGMTPELVGSYISDDIAYSTVTGPGLMFTAIERDYIEIRDVSDPAIALTDVERVDELEDVRDLAMHDGLVCAAAGDAGLQVYSVDPQGRMSLESLSMLGGPVEQVTSDGDVLFVRIAGDRLAAFDLQDPANPVELGSVVFGYNAKTMVAYDGKLIVSDPFKGVFFYDFSPSDGFDLIAHRVFPGTPEDLVLQWPYIWMTTGGSTLQLVDCSDYSDPQTALQTQAGTFFYECVRMGDSLFFTQGQRLVRYDVSDPTSPVFVDEVEFESEIVSQLGAGDGYVMLAGHEFNLSEPMLYLYEIDDMGATALRAKQRLPRYSESMVASDQRVFVGAYEDLLAFDASACGQCSADLNGDGALDFFDVSAFLVAFADSDASGDWNDDGQFDFFDVSGFLVDFQGGCP